MLESQLLGKILSVYSFYFLSVSINEMVERCLTRERILDRPNIIVKSMLII